MVRNDPRGNGRHQPLGNDPRSLRLHDADQLRGMGSRLANAELLPPEFQIHWFDNPDHAND